MARRRKAKTYWEHDVILLVEGFVKVIVVLYMMGILMGILLSTVQAIERTFQELYPLGCILLISLFLGVPTIRVLLKLRRRRRSLQRLRLLALEDVDYMPGHTFERYVARLLQSQGYKTIVTKGSGDFGVDIVAQRYAVRYAVQCKRQFDDISRRAVSDAVAGKYQYGCSEAIVVTNSYFTSGAVELANSTGCILVDRDTLAEWIAAFQQSRKPKIKSGQQPSHFSLARLIEKLTGTQSKVRPSYVLAERNGWRVIHHRRSRKARHLLTWLRKALAGR
ncbi:MAG: restriction endonuclease [Chloroflexota bacterium]|jgi:restriction system protein